MNSVKVCGLVAAMTLAVSQAAVAGSLTIQQVPENSTPAEPAKGNAVSHAKKADGVDDYQSDILPRLNPNDRAHAGTAAKPHGNSATIVQSGNSNASSITQAGDNNYASQSQKGDHNDLRIEQNGKNNVSVEDQQGSYNHKVKIQDGNKTEETTMEHIPGDDDGSKD